MSNTPTKCCSGCKEIKEFSGFNKNKKTEDGLRYECKSCQKAIDVTWDALPFDLVPEIKTCTRCNIGKDPKQFSKTKGSKDGLYPQCKDCNKINANLYKEQPLDPQVDKVCNFCNKKRSPDEYNLSKTGRDGLQSTCRDCAREAKIRKNYGISTEYYNEILKEQDWKCAICFIEQDGNKIHHTTRKPARFVVDHCHKTGKIRGLLCDPCNRALGALRDNPKSAENAATYLRSGGSIKQKGTW